MGMFHQACFNEFGEEEEEAGAFDVDSIAL
jgi:hypothetical protein